MTTAWEWLQSNSSVSGTAWDLISNPKVSGTIVNDTILVETNNIPIDLLVSTSQILVELTNSADIVISANSTSVELSTSTQFVEIQYGTVLEIDND